ncbi:MAG: response regulator [Bdellovibrionota bacterium]
MSNLNPAQSKKFLLVEDDDDHAKILERSFKKGNTNGVLIRVSNGVQAMEYLHQEDQNSLPDVILLDLKLPLKDGHEVLQEIKEDNFLKFIPVIILTTSDAEADTYKAYNYHANSYLVKPLDRDSFSQMIQDMIRYWSTWNKQIDYSSKIYLKNPKSQL